MNFDKSDFKSVYQLTTCIFEILSYETVTTKTLFKIKNDMSDQVSRQIFVQILVKFMDKKANGLELR